MKKNIHPEYHTATVTCACGETFEVGSTEKAINIEICSVCHPFYTGKQKLVDTAGMVDKFKARMERAKALQEQNKSKKKKSEDSSKKEEKKTLEDLKQ